MCLSSLLLGGSKVPLEVLIRDGKANTDEVAEEAALAIRLLRVDEDIAQAALAAQHLVGGTTLSWHHYIMVSCDMNMACSQHPTDDMYDLRSNIYDIVHVDFASRAASWPLIPRGRAAAPCVRRAAGSPWRAADL